MKAESVEIGQKVKLRHSCVPLPYEVTLPSGTVLEIDSPVGSSLRRFWVKTTRDGRLMRFQIDCSEIDE